MVDIALLGCGGGMPIPERFLSALLINYQGRKILVDCGEGTQVSMKLLGWGFKSIDVICITHGHGDHVIGLPGLLATIGNSGRTEPITIIGPKGIREIVTGLRVVAPYLPYEINILEGPEAPVDVNLGGSLNDLTISSIMLEHSAFCLGYSFYFRRKPKFDIESALKNQIPKIYWNRLQKNEVITDDGNTYLPSMVFGGHRIGIKVSFITDTSPIDTIPAFIKGSDLFICEGTYGNRDDLQKAIKNKHMTFEQAAQLALEGEVRELLLTHFSPSMLEPEVFKDNAQSIFINSTIGHDRLTKTICFRD